jgi:conjugative relaxase-like TrwC/TraI family protein
LVLRRVTVVASNKAGVDYYANDESVAQEKSKYYSKGLAKGSAKWLGSLKDELGLDEEIIRSEFKKIAYGKHPVSGKSLKGRVMSGESRLFYDFCFSPSKSISEAALVLGETELIECHNRAIAKMVDYIEKNFGAYRVKHKGKETTVHTGKLLFAALNHYTARPVTEKGITSIDPQLHTHLLVMNTTKTADGKWYSLAKDAMLHDLSLTCLYDQWLAEEIQDAGYRIRQTPDRFELADISDEQVTIFSKRRNQAKKIAEEKGQTVREAVLSSRKGKIDDLTLDELRQTWLPQAEGMHVTREDGPVERIGLGSSTVELEHAIAHLSERKVHFSGADIKAFVFEHVQRFSPEELEEAIENHHRLVNLDNALQHYSELSFKGNPRDRFTTPQLIKTELEILRLWGQGLDKVDPLIPSIALEKLQEVRGHNHNGEPIHLNEDQAQAIKNALESTHQFQSIKGLAGVGKTTAIAEFLKQIEAHGIEVDLFGFAATHEAKTELERSLNLKSRTVASLIQNGAEGRIWIADETGMNSNNEYVEMLRKASEQGVRVIAIGDSGQNSSVSNGSPFHAITQKFPESTQSMSKIIRQREQQQLRAVELISAGKGREAIAVLNGEGKIQEIADQGQRAQQIAETFVKLPEKERAQTIIVSGTNAERRAITEALRAALSREGLLGDSTTIQNLVSRNLTEAQTTLGRYYNIGDYVKFYEVPRSSFIKKGDLYRVMGIEGDYIQIASDTKTYAPINLRKLAGKSRIEVLREGVLNVAVGDRVKFTATIKAKDWYNGTQLDITAVSGEWIKGVDKRGKEYKIDITKPVGIDHDWVGTSYSRQGKTAKRAIVSLTSDPTSSRESSTVSISRQTHDIIVFTQDLEQLNRWVGLSNRQPNILDELGRDDRVISALERAVEGFEQYGGKADNYVEYELTLHALEKELQTFREKNYDRYERENRTANHPRAVEELAIGDSSRDSSNGRRVVEQETERSIPDQRESSGVDRSHQGININGNEEQQPTGRAEWSDRPINPGHAGNLDYSAIAETIDRERERRIVNPQLEEVTHRVKQLIQLREQNAGLREDIATGLAEVRKLKMDIEALGNLPTPKPVKVKVAPFWQPEYKDSDRPSNLEPKHWEEMKKSCIHPDLVKLNIRSLYGDQVVQNLLEDALKDIGSGQYAVAETRRLLKEYDTLRDGGWWGTAGTDAQSLLTGKPIPSLNGVFKGDIPRRLVNKPILRFGSKIDTREIQREARLNGIDDRAFKEKSIKAALEGIAIASAINAGLNPNNIIQYKTIKYENPKGIDRPVFLANIPDRLAQAIYEKHGIEPTPEELEKGFWHIVRERNLPVVLIEGHKKALSALSQGVIAIGTPGVALYRSKEKINGQEFKLAQRQLLKDIAVFATPGRQITFAFDQDPPERTRTVWNVRRDMVRSAELLDEAGCQITIAKWRPGQGKGVDDVIAQSGAEVFLKSLSKSQPWESEARIWYRSRYNLLSGIAKNELGSTASQKEIDHLVYKLAVETGDRLDGIRFLGQSAEGKKQGVDYVRELLGRQNDLHAPENDHSIAAS